MLMEKNSIFNIEAYCFCKNHSFNITPLANEIVYAIAIFTMDNILCDDWTFV